MPTNVSYKLPDLQSLCEPFELRTNRACRPVMEASEAWLTGLPDALTKRERGDLRRMKIGLLAALCFPTCDQPQLRFVTDFWTLLVVANRRARPGQNPAFDGLFLHLADRTERLESAAPTGFRTRFRNHLSEHQAAEKQAVANEAPDSDVDAYIAFARRFTGLNAIFDLIAAVEALDLPHAGEERELLEQLTTHAVDLISWSWDIVAYNVDQSADRKHNVVQVILNARRGLTIQGAVTAAFAHAEKAQRAFLECERTVRERLEPPPPPPSPAEPTWGKTLALLLGFDSEPPAPAKPQCTLPAQQRADALRYVQGLRDCIAGMLHWAYETEMFFGRKQGVRSYIRTFGWVFLLDKGAEDEDEEGSVA
ncbi:isoprenoid synthase domain-containing protein [Schizophyllum commune]